ncbi:creatininase family protein [Frondihabitans sp. PAMC 28766]|uniref:creatininase family protein n=1 Tax=Frondihabitans sp. PAMC 28766 TaxID=1795630 RepID=UPI00194DFEB3|nr:creatininase family protein [Frondihabitans sp. PAMC 28766]
MVATSVNRCPTAPLAPDHAGTFETTLLHGLAPGLVHLERLLSLDDAPAIDDGLDPQGAQRHDRANPLWGIFGPDPRRADLSKGLELVEAIAGWLAHSVREQLAG